MNAIPDIMAATGIIVFLALTGASFFSKKDLDEANEENLNI